MGDDEIVNALHDKMLSFWSAPDETLVKDFLTEMGREAVRLLIDESKRELKTTPPTNPMGDGDE